MKKYLLASLCLLMLVAGCNNSTRCNDQPKETADAPWQERFAELLPMLGHRNWVVVTDMAYPLQSSQGITTMFADQPYVEVVGQVKTMINKAPHVFAHLYRDRELDYITDDMVKGIGQLKAQIEEVCGSEAQSIMHEELIGRLDEASRLFNVLIIKTPMTVPYTTAFFELDCAYWDSERAEELNRRLTE